MTKYGGIESGGSTWECAIAMGPEDLCAVTTIPTTTPEETIGRSTSSRAQGR
jgi:fructokinase